MKKKAEGRKREVGRGVFMLEMKAASDALPE